MKVCFSLQDQTYEARLEQPVRLGIPLVDGPENPVAWYLDPPSISPVELENYTGSVARGGSTNFNSIWFNPHAHGTHTECLGHISPDFYPVELALKKHFFSAALISVSPESREGDLVITQLALEQALSTPGVEAVVVRTLPNTPDKLHKKYSHTNPPYFEWEALEWLKNNGVDHLLTDLPSVDREMDGGALKAHKAFWNYPEAPRLEATITELIFVPDDARDGLYLLNLVPAPFRNDASPSNPVLYPALPVHRK